MSARAGEAVQSSGVVENKDTWESEALRVKRVTTLEEYMSGKAQSVAVAIRSCFPTIR